MYIKIHYNSQSSQRNNSASISFESKFDCLSGGLDIGADQGLVENRQQAALGLLSLSGAGADEVVDISGCGRGCKTLVTIER